MLPSRSGILAKVIKQCIQTSITNTIYISRSLLKCPHFRSIRLELFCQRGILKNFAKFTGVFSGTGVSCEFCGILKNTFFPQNTSSGCFWHLLQLSFSILILYVINHHLSREFVQFLVWQGERLFSYFISGFPNFSYFGFFRKCSMFLRSIPLR